MRAPPRPVSDCAMGVACCIVAREAATTKRAKSKAYKLCDRAYGDKKTIDLQKLRGACQQDTTEALNAVVLPYGLTALACVILNEISQPEAVATLLEHGADPFVSPDRSFIRTAFGIAIKYDKVELLALLLDRVRTHDDWRRLVGSLLEVPCLVNGSAGIAKGIRVELDDGSRGTTLRNDQAGKAKVRLDDETEVWAEICSLRVLAALPSSCKHLFIARAEASGCDEDLLAEIQGLEDGSYGDLPRALSAGSVAIFVGG